jgi:phosphoglycerol transferase
LLVLVGAFGLNLIPSYRYVRAHGPNLEVAHRSPEESEIYALKIAQLLLPATRHRVAWMAALKDRYNRRILPLWVNENDFASLGLVAAAGFILLIAWILFRGYRFQSYFLLDCISELNLAALLLGTVGGFGMLFALIISPEIRGYNRICVFIAFFSFAAAACAMDWAAKSRRSKAGRALTYCLTVLLLPLGLLDQTTKSIAPDHRALQAEFSNDREFVQRIEAAVPSNAMVYQLPYVGFPESAPVQRMYDYDHFRAYLNSHTVRWSYGAMRGRAADKWQKAVAALPVPEFLECLRDAGFNGVYVNRQGYADNAAKLERDLKEDLGEPVVSRDRRLAFFALPQAAAGVCSVPWNHR